jgi:hypothetical protein
MRAACRASALSARAPSGAAILACLLLEAGTAGTGSARAAAPPAAPAPEPARAPVSGPPGPPLVLAAASASAASPRPVPESERVAADIAWTDRLIAVIRPKVLRSGNAFAKEDLAQARDRQSEARLEFEQDHFARADRLTFEARALARSASVRVGPPQDDPVYVDRALDGARDALDLAGDILDEEANPRGWRRYQALKQEYKGARRDLKEGRTRAAYQGAVAVRDGVLDLLRAGKPAPVTESSAARAIDRAGKAMEWAAKELGSRLNADAVHLKRAAVSQMNKAKGAYQRRDYRDAVIYCRLAERNLEQAVAAQRNGVKRGA